MPFRRLLPCVLLPFGAGYLLSYIFRTINTLISGRLAEEIGLRPSQIGLLTSVYFLVMLAVQLPIGTMLDRFGPRRVQLTLLPFTAIGAIIFASAESTMGLVAGRLLIGLGLSAALMSGLKAVVLWLPIEHVGRANGQLVMSGGLGAVIATSPAQTLIDDVGWRAVFVLLAAATLACLAVVYCAVPRAPCPASAATGSPPVRLRVIFTNADFWRLAPMSATCIGSAWAIQGLWAGPWLADVEGFDASTINRHLLVMAIALCAGALGLGALADRLRRMGLGAEVLFGTTAALSILAQAAVVLRWPVPSYLAWAVIAMAGAATVLSYAILPGYFPKEGSGRANAALDLLHLGVAFLVQWLIGVVIDLWPTSGGHHPVEAFQAAIALNLALQVVAIWWFAAVAHSAKPIAVGNAAHYLSSYNAQPQHCRYREAHLAWLADVSAARHQASNWRRVAIASIALCMVMTTLTLPGLAGLSDLEWPK